MNQYRDRLINLNLLLLAIIGSALVIYIGWRVFEVIFSVLILLLAAMVLAFLLDPLVARLQATGLPRGLSVLGVYLVLLALIFGLGGLLIVPLTGQIQALARNLPSESNQLGHELTRLNAFFKSHNIPIDLQSLKTQGLSKATQVGTQLLSHTLDIVQTVARIVIDILAIIVISAYLLIDGPRLRHNILRIIPENSRKNVLFVEAAVRVVVGSYVRGQLLLALIIGVMAAAGCFLLGVKYPLVLGLAAGFFELVPMLGPILGALPAIGVAAFQSWQLAVATAILYIVIQQLEAHIIAPRVMGHAVGVHPVVAILAVLLGVQLDGILGALVAVPVAGIVYVISQAIYSNITGQHQLVTVVQRRPLYIRLYRWIRGLPARTGAEEKDASITVTVEAPSDQLAGIVHEAEIMAEQFAEAERVAHGSARGDQDGRTGATSAEAPPVPEESRPD
jgi:predicted PurR-regulated permease PerM